MPIRYDSSYFRAALALAFLLALAACTPAGQFDPTEIFHNDMFDTKSKLKGQRIPLFPNGVPGTTTGVPADLVKGYKPPPDQADANPDSIGAPPPDEAAKPEEQPKPKPKPKVAVARPRTPVPKPPSSNPTRIDIGAKGTPAQQPSQATWPNSPPPAAPSQQAGQFTWPAPPPVSPGSQAVQPAPPPQSPAPASQSGAPQSGPSFDAMWPKPPASDTSQ